MTDVQPDETTETDTTVEEETAPADRPKGKEGNQVARLLAGKQKREPSARATNVQTEGGGEHQLKGLFGEANTIEAGLKAGELQRKLAALSVDDRQELQAALDSLAQTPNPTADEAADLRDRGEDALDGVENLDDIRSMGDGGVRDEKGVPTNSNLLAEGDDDLDSKKKDELVDIARDEGVEGFSELKKDELVAAIRENRQG